MLCHCGLPTQVLESRINLKGVKRRRECAAGHRFTTLEVVVSVGHGKTVPDVVVLPALGNNHRVNSNRRKKK